MSGDDIAIKVSGLSKCYQIYDKPQDRLKQSIYPPLQRFLGKPAKQYCREFWALKNVSFEIKKGETVGIIGRNGSGKSTLLQMICGTLNPTSGSIATHGRIAALLELGSGFNPEFTGRENVYMNASVLGLRKEEIDARFAEIAAFSDIGDFIEQPIKTYSSGMYVRLAFAVQVCVDPDILIVDEALAVGDAYFVHRCFHRIREMKIRGKTILFVSHDTGSVKNLCDRAMWIDDGSLRVSGEPDEITRQYRAYLFGIRVKNHQEIAFSKPLPSLKSPLKEGLPEKSIPNADRRLGNQACRLLGVGIYSPTTYESVVEVKSGGEFLLRMSFMNESLEAGSSLIVGYAMCSPKGEEIGAVNSAMERMEILSPDYGLILTVRAHIVLPILHRGNYALSIAVTTESGVGVEILDRVENAIVFHISESSSVVGLMRFPTTFAFEQA